jgi:zinc transport system ATP-binding protein
MQEEITIKNLYFGYDNSLVLEDVNLSIKKGEFVGFVGPNGGGKTSLLKLIMGLYSPSQGKIKIFGKTPKDFLSFGYVPQTSSIDRNFPITVFELVLLGSPTQFSFFGRYPKKDKEKTNFLLHQMDLFEKRNNSFGSLSGGETQKALIARALMSDPEILVLDEPTANVDVNAEREIFELLLQFKMEKTILMVTHDLDFIVKHVKNVVFVQKKVTTALPERVCEHFALGLYHKPYLKKGN